mgnify:CR=1 FL=1
MSCARKICPGECQNNGKGLSTIYWHAYIHAYIHIYMYTYMHYTCLHESIQLYLPRGEKLRTYIVNTYMDLSINVYYEWKSYILHIDNAIEFEA